jgi:hypothetical protein
MRRTLWIVALIVANLTLTTWAQRKYVFNGVGYSFPASQGAATTALSATDGSGTLGWVAVPPSSGWPSNLVVFTPTGTCPSGWTEYTDARGRAVVGLVASGTNVAIVGTALTNAEDRASGQHAHGVTDPGHTHTQDAHAHGVTDSGHAHGQSLGTANVSIDAAGNDGIGNQNGAAATTTTTTGVTVNNATATNVSATTGVTLGNAGNVASTNAPYLQLKACRTP